MYGMAFKTLVAATCLAVALADTDQGDVAALQGLTSCVQANAAGKGYLMGWGTSASSGSDATTAAIQATNAQLAAAGVPGVTANSASSTPTGMGGSNDPCGNPVPWTGIQCSGNRITQVLVSQLGPNSLPCDVGSLAGLSGLSAAQNVDFTAVGLTGQLPDAWSSGFGSLTSLKVAQNKISGSLPSAWSSGFGALQTLDFDQNAITGPLPSSWSAGFPQLINLVAGNNNLSGSLPVWSGGFQNAQLFGFSTNGFTGAIPSNWAFPNLTTLELYSNQLTGCLPATLQLPKLNSLTVQGNNLGGSIPSNYDNWGSLNTIQITPGNNFCGTISPTFAKTPDGQGQRFKVAPTSPNSQGGYTLPACSGTTC